MYKMYYKKDKYHIIDEKKAIICEKILDKNNQISYNYQINKTKRGNKMNRNIKKNLKEAYKDLYGEQNLKSSEYYNYTKREYKSAINDYEELDRNWDDKFWELVYKRRTSGEIRVLKNLKLFI